MSDDRRATFEELRRVFQLIQQSGQRTTENENHLINLLTSLVPESLQEEWIDSLDNKEKGCSETFIASLPRVDLKYLTETKHGDATCAICFTDFQEDEYPLIAQLPYCKHQFDYECISIWLSKNETCPVCRDNVLSHKKKIDTKNLEVEEDWGMYG